MIDLFEKVFTNLRNGNDDIVFFLNDYKDYGCSTGEFSKADIDAELTKVQNNEPILEQLAELDKYVSRETEDLIIATNTDSFLVDKANQKKVLRNQLL